MTHIEHRYAPVEAPADALRLYGFAAKYEVDSRPLLIRGVQTVERIAVGAFRDSLARDSQSLYWQHQSMMPLASTSSGTLVLRDSHEGLAYEATLPDTQLARDAVALVRAGVVSQMSFGFIVEDEDATMPHGVRRVTRASLREISLVEQAAYPQTIAAARSHTPLTRLDRPAMRLRLRIDRSTHT